MMCHCRHRDAHLLRLERLDGARGRITCNAERRDGPERTNFLG